MTWSNAYIGLPSRDLGRDRNGVDCWGLVRLVYAEQLNIDLPSYAGAYTDPAEHRETAALINAVEASEPWRPVDAVKPFDLLLFRLGRYRCHVGVALDTRRMLHVQGRDCAKLEPFRQGRWATRFNGAFRHF